MMVRLYMQVLSRDSDSRAPEPTCRPTNRCGRLCVLCIGLLVLLIPSGPAAVTGEPTDPNGTQVESPQLQKLSETLESLIRQLRELRSNHYLQKAQDDAQIQKVRRNSEILQSDLDDLRQQDADLGQQIQRYKSEVEGLKKQLVLRSTLQTVVRRQIKPFRSSQRAAIESGAPYKQQDRIARLEAACEDSNDANAISVADQLDRVWSYAQEELRLARSSETYTARIPSEDGASPYARYFRVGQLILGYVTEDGRQTGMWLALPDKKGWLSIFEPKQANQVRDAVEILDRRQGPKLVTLPVAIQSENVGQGTR